ncbi:MAG: DNA polymerase [Clostridiales bacterium]|nr:DNA polymerase [Clostridiales bacterium]
MGTVIRHLSLDLETYSPEPIAKAGLYRYVEHPDFEILLCAYSIDGEQPRVIDVCKARQGYSDSLSAWLDVLQLIEDPDYIKHAYNAPFEVCCLSKIVGHPLDASQWRCTMLHGLYCGLPAGLDAVGKAMGLPQEKQKLNTGRVLIKYFCVPCNATIANGHRTRNLPQHDPAKWQLFMEYCAGDVVAEMEILRRLSAFPVPGFIQKQWETDQRINGRGVAVDMELVTSAVSIGLHTRQQLMQEAKELTGLSNPNSTAQLTAWLNEAEEDEEISNLRKDTVRELLERDLSSVAARRVLEIRQELSKTSTKKYDSICTSVCKDGRVRGLLQYYGAGRTGRWAGRLVQVHNLPRTYIEPLVLARNAIKTRQFDTVRLLWGSIPDTLSQLIRTAFIAPEGHILLDADFSAIETRVIAWLAGEEWKLEVFQTHGKIYEASAALMFGVPMELIKKGNPEYELRQRGKIAELGLGYGMGATKFRDTAESQYNVIFTIEEATELVNRWRSSNPRICALWQAIGDAARATVETGKPMSTHHINFIRQYDQQSGLNYLNIVLPSGRMLFYTHPTPATDQWGRPSIAFMGVDQTKKTWGRIETYGGKLVENIVQAIARDCLAEAIEQLEEMGYRITFHVHDEVVIEVPIEQANLVAVCEIMSMPPLWALNLPLGADGWVNEFYKKD